METPLIGCSPSHRNILQLLEKVAPTNAEILITGPSGVGKELYARYAHGASHRAGRALVPVNCGAIPENLLENEMFGHGAGAYTGAGKHHDGLVTEAEGGTLFLDEVDMLKPANQVKLLRFLQNREYRRLGERRLRKANVRVIAATNADLVTEVARGTFREDLFFRLRVVPVKVPALAERPEDIDPLLDAYIRHFALDYGLNRIRLEKQARARLNRYAWPGNIRELKNCVQYLTCLQLDRPVHCSDLSLLETLPTRLPSADDYPTQPFQAAKRQLVSHFEKAYLDDVLTKTQGNIARAARESGKARRAFFELMRKHGLDAADYRMTRTL